MTESLRPAAGDALVLVGTAKGAWFYHADAKRQAWHASGPHFPGQSVYALA